MFYKNGIYSVVFTWYTFALIPMLGSFVRRESWVFVSSFVRNISETVILPILIFFIVSYFDCSDFHCKALTQVKNPSFYFIFMSSLLCCFDYKQITHLHWWRTILQCIQKCSLHVEEETTRAVAYLRAILVVICIIMFGVFPELLTRWENLTITATNFWLYSSIVVTSDYLPELNSSG